MMSEETNDFKPLADADDATSQQPVTAEMLGITPKDTGLPLVVVSDGKMVPRSLELLHLSPADIERRLKNQSIAVEDVFLMTLDDCGNTFLQKKEGRV